MQILAGTSGFSYPEWRGHFYPSALPDAQMLHFYADRLPSVEINNTFYRMPKPETVAAWRDEVGGAFRFAVKATRRITHQQKLADVGDDVAHLFSVAEVLGDKLGSVLFQLPPFLKKDIGLLRAFLLHLPAGRRSVLEFRHASWFGDDVFAALSEHNVALCAGDLEDLEKSPPLVATADFGYLRLRRPDYDPPSIADWGARIAAQRWQTAYAYFKHESLGPMFAEALLAHLGGREMADLTEARASLRPPSQKPKSARGAASKIPKGAEPRASRGPEPRVSKTPGPRASKSPAARTTKAPKSSKR